jgi:hypothetical protein
MPLAAQAEPVTPTYRGTGRPPLPRYPRQARGPAHPGHAGRVRREPLRHLAPPHTRHPPQPHRPDALPVPRPPGPSSQPAHPPPRRRQPARVLADAEWPPGTPEPTDYWLSTLPPDTALRELVRLAKMRWRIEHDYPRAERRPRSGPLRRPLLPGLAPPRHPRQRGPGHLHTAALRPCAGLTLYAALRELQALLVVWAGVCHTCKREQGRLL